MGTMDIVVFVAFVAAVIGIGLYKSKGEDTHGDQGAADYFLAGRGLSWWLVGFSLIAANISTEQFVGMSGQAADWLGMAIASYEWMAAITLVIVAFVFLPKFLKCGIYTIPEFLEYRYNTLARTVMAIATMVILVGVPTASVIYSGAKVIVVFFTDAQGQQILSITAGCWIIGSLAALYVFAGGLKACAWADLIQGAALIIGGAIIAYLVWDKLGSADVAELATKAKDLDLNTLKDASALERLEVLNPGKLTMFKPATDPSIPWTSLLIGLWIPNFFYWGLNQYIMQRSLGSKSLGEGQKGIVFAAALKLIIPFVVVIPGILAFNLFSKDLATSAGVNADQSFKISQAQNKVVEFNEDFALMHTEMAVKVYQHNAVLAGVTATTAIPESTDKFVELNNTVVEAAVAKKIEKGTKMVGYDTDAAFPTLLKIVPKGGLLGF
ncbi:MAG: sodium:solute symporter family transporter, partial [Lentisphaeria bacterium]